MSCLDQAETASGARVYSLPDGQPVLVRPIRPQDAAGLQSYFQELSGESRRNRFLGTVSQVAPAVLARLTGGRRADQAGFVAFAAGDQSPIGETVQVTACAATRSEIALSVVDAWQRRGLGLLLMQHIECEARRLGTRHLFGDVLRTNTAMKGLARKAGFSIASPFTDARLIEIVKDLSPTQPGPLCRAPSATLPPVAA